MPQVSPFILVSIICTFIILCGAFFCLGVFLTTKKLNSIE